MCTHNLCFEQKEKNYQNFSDEFSFFANEIAWASFCNGFGVKRPINR